VNHIVTQAEDDPSTPLERGPGGVIRYRGSEKGTVPGIYYDVRRVVRDYWGPRRGLRGIEVEITASRGKRGVGVWTHPDIVMCALPRRRQSADAPPDLHSIEVEVWSGFDIRSVYQAHAQGKGAEFSWVFYATSNLLVPDYERIIDSAEDLGIGMVEFKKAASFGTYETILDASRRDVTKAERNTFCEHAGVPEWTIEL
jgi:hypothetical protein